MNLFQQKFGSPDTGDWYSTRPLNFRPKIACRRDDENPPIHFTARQTANHVASRYGQPNCTLLETLLPNTRAKPYFDFEVYLDEEADTQQILQQQVLPPILCSLEIEAEDVRAASRHGWVKKDGGRKFKVSFRAFVQGKWLPVQNMNTVIGRPEFEDPAWDKGVYPRQGERMMAVVGGVKGKNGDVRVLEPLKTGYPYHDYLIQGLDGNEEEMDVLPPNYVTKVPKNGIHSLDAASGHVAEKPSWLSLLMDEDMVNLATDYMITKGMRNFKTGRISGNTLQILNEPGNLRICMHGQMHKSNTASVLFYQDKRVMYKCYSSKCFDKEACELGTWSVVLPTSMDEMTEGDLMKLNVEMARQLVDSNMERLAVQYMNRFLIAVGISHPEVVMLEFDERDEVKDYVIRTFAETGTWMSNGGRAFQVWKESPERREVRDYQWELKQENCERNKFNLFTGKLPMSHIDREGMATEEDLAHIQPILDHIRLHFCNGEDELGDYFLNWLAFPLQRLGQKTGVAVVIKGLPGTGKGLIINHLMSAIYGEHYCQCKDIKDLTGNFNAHTVKKMFVNLDEATFGGFKTENQALKNFITEPKAMMQEKFKDQIHINSYVNLVITTNEDFPVEINENDRRYFVLQCSDDIAKDHDYWGPLLPLFHENLPKTRDAFYRYLMGRDLTGFNVRVFPHTEARAAIMVQSRFNVTAFLQDFAMHPDAGSTTGNEVKFVSIRRLYELYGVFVRDGGVFGKQADMNAFSKRMKTLLPGCGKRTSKERGFHMPTSADLESMMRRRSQWSDDQF